MELIIECQPSVRGNLGTLSAISCHHSFTHTGHFSWACPFFHCVVFSAYLFIFWTRGWGDCLVLKLIKLTPRGKPNRDPPPPPPPVPPAMCHSWEMDWEWDLTSRNPLPMSCTDVCCLSRPKCDWFSMTKGGTAILNWTEGSWCCCYVAFMEEGQSCCFLLCYICVCQG